MKDVSATHEVHVETGQLDDIASSSKTGGFGSGDISTGTSINSEEHHVVQLFHQKNQLINHCTECFRQLYLVIVQVAY